MTKEVQMTFRIEPELRDDFMAVAASVDRPAAQMLRELMRSVVQEARQNESATKAAQMARAEREDAERFALASLRLEGFEPSAAVREQARQFVEGKLSLSEFVKVQPNAKQDRSR